MRTHLRAELVTEALDMAIEQRRPYGVIHHSDRGSQYTSIAFGNRCQEAGILASMGSVGDCYGNALCESFFATLECELLARTSFPSPTEARRAVFDYLEGFYNHRRRHSALGQVSPVRFESMNQPQLDVHADARAMRFRGKALNFPPDRGNSSRSLGGVRRSGRVLGRR